MIKITHGSTISAIVALAVILTVLAMPSAVWAVTYNQPTTFTIGDAASALEAYAYKSVIDANDALFMARFYIDYAVAADAPNTVGDAYIGIVRYDGTAISTVRPVYTFDSGVAQWFFAVYLSQSTVSDWNTTFGETMWSFPAKFEIAIAGNPTLTWAGGSPPAEQAISDFTSDSFNTETDTDTVHVEYTEPTIRMFAQYFEDASGGTLDLIQNVGEVNKLTSDGETYFGASIANLRSIAPGVFMSTMQPISFSEQEAINDSYAVLPDQGVAVYGVNWTAQTFTASDGYEMSGVSLRAYRVGAPGAVTVALRAVAAGVPSGANLASGSKSGNDWTTWTEGDWVDIAYTADYTLVSGTTYAIIISAAAGDVNNYVTLRYVAAGGYAGGQKCDSVNSGVAWAADAGKDTLFSTITAYGVSLSYADKQTSYFDETGFGNPAGGMEDLGDEVGLGVDTTKLLIWVIVSVVIAMYGAGYVGRLNDGNTQAFGGQSGLFTAILGVMAVAGGVTGFIDVWYPIAIGAICSVSLIYTIFWGRSAV